MAVRQKPEPTTETPVAAGATLSNTVYESLKDDILSADLPPGTKLTRGSASAAPREQLPTGLHA